MEPADWLREEETSRVTEEQSGEGPRHRLKSSFRACQLGVGLGYPFCPWRDFHWTMFDAKKILRQLFGIFHLNNWSLILAAHLNYLGGAKKKKKQACELILNELLSV